MKTFYLTITLCKHHYGMNFFDNGLVCKTNNEEKR